MAVSSPGMGCSHLRESCYLACISTSNGGIGTLPHWWWCHSGIWGRPNVMAQAEISLHSLPNFPPFYSLQSKIFERIRLLFLAFFKLSQEWCLLLQLGWPSDSTGIQVQRCHPVGVKQFSKQVKAGLRSAFYCGAF